MSGKGDTATILCAAVFSAWGLGVDSGTTYSTTIPKTGEVRHLLATRGVEQVYPDHDMAPPNYAEVKEVLFNIGGRFVSPRW
jgi:hypothetical protein